ncbi:MAG: zf-HC2 domain-containing protein [Candidatus Omnitrophica bacterium]|nr:zf-HC2 domain-containing protein [Candidatus Omnitrophota bacterium]
MKCKTARKSISAYLDNEVSEDASNQISQHLSVCKRCQALRAELVLSRKYLKKLKDGPEVTFNPDISDIYETPRKPGVPWAALLTAFVITVLCLAYIVYLPFNPPRSLQKPIGILAKDFDFFKKLIFTSKGQVRTLEENREFTYSTTLPTLVKVADKSWICFDGQGMLYKSNDYLKVNLYSGNVYFTISPAAGLKTMVTIDNIQLISMMTDYSVKRDERNIDVQMLYGKVLLKYGEKSNIGALEISTGDGALIGLNPSAKPLVYKLNSSQISNLGLKINQVKSIGRWQESNPKRANFESGDIRVEFWVGE